MIEGHVAVDTSRDRRVAAVAGQRATLEVGRSGFHATVHCRMSRHAAPILCLSSAPWAAALAQANSRVEGTVIQGMGRIRDVTVGARWQSGCRLELSERHDSSPAAGEVMKSWGGAMVEARAGIEPAWTALQAAA